MAFLFHLVAQVGLQFEQVCLHGVQEVALTLRALLLLSQLLLALFRVVLDANGDAEPVNTVEAGVHVFVIQIVCIGHHQRDTGPVRTKGAICGDDVNIFEFVHADVFLLV